MTTLSEEARWANLRYALEQQLDTWKVPYADACAEGIVADLRRTGWRIPLPDWDVRSEKPGNRRAKPPTATAREHIRACREAIRASMEQA